MRKLLIAVTAMFVLGLAAVAYAQVVNTYDVSGSTNPTRAGSSSRPVPVSVRFGYTVGEQQNRRPSPVRKYSIRFAGLRVNTNAFPRCSASTLENRGPSACPSGSAVGSGFITNATGSRTDPNDKSITCNAALTVYNSGDNRGVIYVAGSPNSTNPRTRCAIELAAPIPARYIRASGGQATSLEFNVPPSLLHPLPTLDNAVTSVTSTIRNITRRRGGRRVGYFESIGGCVRNRRNITVTFTPEQGTVARAQELAPCRR
jgi:hypothetical protein